MPDNKLHIVSFDVPYPPDYGGAIDVFYKVKALANAGCKVILHCYDYGRGQATELEKYCEAVHYYERNTGLRGISLSMPYIVSSRSDVALLKRLQDIDAPILFEGVHTTQFLSHPSLKGRFKVIRTHNVEHEYYKLLAAKEPSFTKRAYYRAEAALLRKYEASLHNAYAFLSLSLTDSDHFQKTYPQHKSYFIPPFHPYDAVAGKTGTGTYCLYHGNLSHPENREAVLYLLSQVIPFTNAQFIIAGKKPAEDLITSCGRIANCELVADPDQATMDRLIENAQVHVLPTFQQTGMKLKLLSALYGGRHVLVNSSMLFGTGLDKACGIANDSKQFIAKIHELMTLPFTEQDIISRAIQLKDYDKAGNAAAILKIMHGGS